MLFRNRRFRSLLAKTATAGMVVGSAISTVVAPAMAGTEFLDTTRNLNLHSSQFQNEICKYYEVTSVLGVPKLQMCSILSNLPGFYSGTSGVYAVNNCNAADPRVFYLGNISAVSESNISNFNGNGGLFPANSGLPVLAQTNVCSDTQNAFGNSFQLPVGFVSNNDHTTQVDAITTFSLYGQAFPQYDSTTSPGYSTALGFIGFTRTDLLSQPRNIPLTVSGTAQLGVDYVLIYNNNSGSVVIDTPSELQGFTMDIGNAQTNLGVQPVYQANDAPAKTVIIQPVYPSGYQAGWGGYGQVTINAVSYPRIDITADEDTTIEPGTSSTFTLSRSGDISAPLTVQYAVGGAAQNGTDYSYLDGSVTIPAGQSSIQVAIAAATRSGSQAIPERDIVLTLTDTPDYNFGAGGGTPIAYSLPAYNPSTLSVAPSGGGTAQPGTTGGFTVTRAGDTSQPLAVNYDLGGTASNGSDYTTPSGNSGTLTIPAGATSATLPITVPSNMGSTARPEENVTFTVTPGSGYDAASNPAGGTLTIPAYTPASVGFGSGSGGTLTPGSTTDGFTVTRGGDTTSPLTVMYDVGGSATPGDDYGQLPGSVTIPAGQTTATVPIRVFPQSGSTAEPAEDVVITLQPGNGYAPDANPSATYTIPAYAPTAAPEVTVSIPANGSTTLTPGQSANGFTVTRTGDLSSPLPVRYSVGGTAQSGSDFTPLDGDVVIPAGQSTATVPISVPSSVDPASDGRTVEIALAPDNGYSSGTNSGVGFTIDVPDVDPVDTGLSTGVSINPPAFVVTRDGDLSQPLTIPYTTGGTAVPGTDYTTLPGSVTIPAGQSSAIIPVEVLPTATDGRNVELYLDPPTGTTATNNGSTFAINSGNIPVASNPTPVSTPTPVPSDTGNGNGTGNGNETPVAVPVDDTDGNGSGNGSNTGGRPRPTSTATDGDDGDGGSSSGSAGLGLGGLVLGGGALSSIALGDHGNSCPAYDSLSGVMENGSTLTASAGTQPFDRMNWSETSFSELPAVDGRPAEQVLTVGQFSDLGSLTLGRVWGMSGSNGSVTLYNSRMVEDTTLKGLSETLYNNADSIGDIAGMAEYLKGLPAVTAALSSVSVEQLEGMSLSQAMEQYPMLQQVNLGNVPLTQVPGLAAMTLSEMSELKVAQVPGLGQVPLAQLFPCLASASQEESTEQESGSVAGRRTVETTTTRSTTTTTPVVPAVPSVQGNQGIR